MAVAAVAVSLLLARQRPGQTDPIDDQPPGESQAAENSLDAIRAAGL